MWERLHRYVGPAEIAAYAREQPAGLAVRDAGELASAVAALAPRAREVVTLTYVVDVEGTLRVADRRSEHVACAGGAPVRVAGELDVDPGEGRVVVASNLSTGYCPTSEGLASLRRALARAGLASDFHAVEVELRKCEACGARGVVKDGVLECAECLEDLPADWNFDRGWHARADVEGWAVYAAIHGGDRDEERVALRPTGRGGFVVVLADGGGGTGRGDSVGRAELAVIAPLDAELARLGGQRTALVAEVSRAGVAFAKVGDGQLHIRRRGQWHEVLHGAPRERLLGVGGRASTERCEEVDAFLLASDGVTRDGDVCAVTDAVDRDPSTVTWSALEAARPPAGTPQDGLSLVIGLRCAAAPLSSRPLD